MTGVEDGDSWPFRGRKGSSWYHYLLTSLFCDELIWSSSWVYLSDFKMRLRNFSLALWRNFRAQWFSLTDSTNHLCLLGCYVLCSLLWLPRHPTCGPWRGCLPWSYFHWGYSLVCIMVPKSMLPFCIISGTWGNFWVPFGRWGSFSKSLLPPYLFLFSLLSNHAFFGHHWSSKVAIRPSSLTVLSQSPIMKVRQKRPLFLAFFSQPIWNFLALYANMLWEKEY